MALLNVKTPTGSYPIYINTGGLSHLGQLLVSHGLNRGGVALVTNPTVARWHLAGAMTGCREAGLAVHSFQIADGEVFKNLDSAAKLYAEFVTAGLDRNTTVVALGGGVIGDLTGFVAATYLRGVNFVQAPTTLLAIVDASVGGKVGIDLAQGKNLVGAFKQPELVMADPQVLETLPAYELAGGMAEVIKHGILGDAGLFETLEEHGTHLSEELLERAILVKIRVVEEDPYEQGIRATLNLGHTFGHAIEHVSQYRVSHGHAVGIGLCLSAQLAGDLGICQPEVANRITRLVVNNNLPGRIPAGLDPQEIYRAMGTDKKRVRGKLRFILPVRLGQTTIRDDVSEAQVLRVLQANLE